MSNEALKPITQRGDELLLAGCVPVEARQPPDEDALIWIPAFSRVWLVV